MPSNLFDLTGRVALVTGGSKGLGKAMARGLAEAGADVVISSRHEDELKAALDEILAGTGRKGAYVVADMAQRAGRQQARRARPRQDGQGRHPHQQRRHQRAAGRSTRSPTRTGTASWSST